MTSKAENDRMWYLSRFAAYSRGGKSVPNGWQVHRFRGVAKWDNALKNLLKSGLLEGADENTADDSLANEYRITQKGCEALQDWSRA
jgi:hypothetical protein